MGIALWHSHAQPAKVDSIGYLPECPVHIGCEWDYLNAAICAYLDEMVCMLLPGMTKVCFELTD